MGDDAEPEPDSASGPVLVLRGLTRTFRDVRALDGLDLVVEGGPVGLLGPNGAGKTTLIKLLLGLIAPDSGEARVLAFDPRRPRERRALRRAVGYMPEGDCLLPGATAVELATTMARLSGLVRRDALTRAHEVLDYVGLEEERYRPLEEYSTGMKQRLKLAQALVHDPPFLLLDEPTNGLDPKGRRHMLELVRDLGRAQGKHLLVCSHLLPDVERTCERVVLLHKGRMLAQGSIEELTRAQAASIQVEVAARRDELARALVEGGLACEPDGALGLRVDLPPGEDDADRVVAAAARAGAPVTRLARKRASLEQVFLGALDAAEGRG